MVAFIEAKPTRYMGEQFRSRLEARWAVFLHHYKRILKWGYETHHLTLTDNADSVLDNYTPDFSFYWAKFPKMLIFLEVKPTKPNKEYFKRLSEFSKYADQPIILAYGSFYKTQPIIIIFGPLGGMGKAIPLNLAFHKCTSAIKKAGNYRFDL